LVELLPQLDVGVEPGVPRQPAVTLRTLRLGEPVAERRRDDGASAGQQRLRMARLLGPRHGEAHVGEEPARTPLADVAFGVGFGPVQRVVLNPGSEAGGGRIHVIGEHGDWTNAELIAVPATNVHPIPDGLSFEEAAAFPLVFETAYRMLVTRAGLGEGEWVLLWGIGSGVSTAGLAIARALGAQTIVTSSSDAKLQRARELGADVTVNHADGDVKAAVKEATGGH